MYGFGFAIAAGAPGGDDWVTVKPVEFEGAINNPLKGFRSYHRNGYGLLHRQYIGWNAIELSADDTVERIIARTNEITRRGGKTFGELNIKLVPRVYLDWDGTPGTAERPKRHWPADLAEFDYDSPAFDDRLKRLIAELGEAWDNDPRLFAVQMGLIGYWGEHHLSGGWHSFGVIGIGAAPRDTALKGVAFDSPAFDRTLSYEVPEELLAVQPPPAPKVTPMSRWAPDPQVELINPWRYWVLIRRSDTIEKRVSAGGPVEGPAGRRVLSVIGDYGRGSSQSWRSLWRR